MKRSGEIAESITIILLVLWIVSAGLLAVVDVAGTANQASVSTAPCKVSAVQGRYLTCDPE